MLETIGQAAGQVWTFLAQSEDQVKVTDIPKKTGLKPQIAYQALGWLAREGKITYHSKGRTLIVSLQVCHQ